MTVTLPFDPFWEPLHWAKKYCSSYITNDMHCNGYNTYDATKIDYHFSDEKDVIMFILRWA